MKTRLIYKTASSVDCLVDDVSLGKALSPWQPGDGGMLDSGAVAPNTTYHMHMITDGEATDLLASAAPVSPLVPAGWQLAGQVAGSLLTGPTGAIRPFRQNGREFWWTMPAPTDLNSQPNGVDTLRAVSVPLGVKALYICLASAFGASPGWVYMSDPDGGPPAGAPGCFIMRRNTSPEAQECRVWTNASQQIYTADSFSGATLTLIGKGYMDPRVDA